MLCVSVRVVRRQGHICGKIKHFFSERCGNVPYFNVFDALTGGNAGTIRLCPKQYKIAKDLSEIENIGLLWANVPRFCLESTEVSIKEVRCFRFPVPSLSYSYVSTSERRERLFSAYPEKNCNTFLLSPKKSFEKKPTFPTPQGEIPCFC